MSEKTVWVSFDFSFEADYSGMYAWIDKHGGKECSDSLAAIKYDCNGDLVAEIEQDIKRLVKLGRDDRIYIIWQEEGTGKIKGKFIYGGRTRARWYGYGREGVAETEDE